MSGAPTDEDILNSEFGKQVLATLESDPEMIEMDRQLHESIVQLAHVIEKHVDCGFKLLISTHLDGEEVKEIDTDLLKYRMIHGIIDGLPGKLGPMVAESIFGDKWKSLAVRDALSMLVNLDGTKPADETKILH